MHDSDYQRLLAQLRSDEGLRLSVYRCPGGARTIGYGHNLDANPVPGIGDTITRDQAERLLEADVHGLLCEVPHALPWVINLTPPRYAAILNMAFNLGVAGLLTFKTTLGLIRVGNYKNAATNLLKNKKWCGQVGKRANRIAAQIESGVWQ